MTGDLISLDSEAAARGGLMCSVAVEVYGTWRGGRPCFRVRVRMIEPPPDQDSWRALHHGLGAAARWARDKLDLTMNGGTP